MLKEIFEIPQVFKKAITWRVDIKWRKISSSTLDNLVKYKIKKIEIIASWTSYHAWLTASYWFETLANIPTCVYVSAEYKYKKHFINNDTLYIFISQSGETADTLECLKIVKEKWWLTFGIVNVIASSIAHLTDMWLYTYSWVEVGVASTKAFIWQLAVLVLIALKLWKKNNMDMSLYNKILEEIYSLDNKLDKVLNESSTIRDLAKKYMEYKNIFFLEEIFFFQ